MILLLDDVNSRLPWDLMPFYWTHSASKSSKPIHRKEKLRITTSRNRFKPIDLNAIHKRKRPEELNLQGTHSWKWLVFR